jgi:hypothetical protein
LWLCLRSGPEPSAPPTATALYSDWLKGFERTEPEAATSDLAALVLSSEGQRLCQDAPEVADLARDEVKPVDLCRLEVIRLLIKDTQPNPHALLSDKYRPVMQELAGDEPTREQVLKIRIALGGVLKDWDELRKQAAQVPTTGDTSLVWLEFLQRSRGDDLRRVVLPRDPVMPFFGDREGALVQNFEVWLNSGPARSAFSPERYRRLYRRGKISPLPTELAGYKQLWTEDIESESARAVREHPREAADLRSGYLALLEFLTRFSQQLSRF